MFGAGSGVGWNSCHLCQALVSGVAGCVAECQVSGERVGLFICCLRGSNPQLGMKLLFLASLRLPTGNRTTAQRISKYIQSSGHICILRDIAEFKSPSQVSDLINEQKFEAVMTIHLYKGGKLLLGSNVPYGVIFGGTDINEDIQDEKKHEVMETVLQKSRFLVAFTDQLKKTAEMHWPFASSKIHVQPQAIVTKPSTKFNWEEFLQSSGIHCKNIEAYVFLLVCGLRRVKDPLFLVDAFSAWHKKDPRVYLIIIGPEVDVAFTQQVKAKVKNASGICLVSEKPQEELHAAMRNSFAVVNSSISEGMSSAILEAMDLNVPVLARNIPGNIAIVKHEHTGLLFFDPSEFIELSKRLITDTHLKENIVVKAKEYVEKYHSWDTEKKTYQKLIENLL
ncbi:glycosyltransferase 1 domain-containing protein 1 isoform X2 [Rhincodon typus]|uniref:glycosyltransferase 1 domain-containing protein 1 isoform X2 n=1 Tax=Rhincodon typus TaxID=259920 RepID=UPI0020305DD2|nr:glycosyltransferase 1 domain-containing protein 1 isoform X2 [Rhincodon typus]